MDRKPDGTILTNEDLIAIGLFAGLDRVAKIMNKGIDKFRRSDLLHATLDLRHALLANGSLRLALSTDPDVVALLASGGERGLRDDLDDDTLEFTVEVCYTDRSRTTDGTFTTFTTSVTVLAETDTEARLIAAQMADAIRRDKTDGMVLSATVVGVAA